MPRARSTPHLRAPRSAGQTLVFLIAALVILVFVALWGFDLHKIIAVKILSQNAGDAAALAAARWQGQTLNVIGDLNILQAVALADGDTVTAAAVADLQARLCYVGPMIALVAAQQAAKQNGVYNNPDYTRRVADHALVVRTAYPTAVTPSGTMLFPEPYPGCWHDYSDMLFTIAADGIAAAPDNARFYTDYSSSHILLSPDFYEAVAGRLWCWFLAHAPGLLSSYAGYTSWPPLPPTISASEPMNSEYFGLCLDTRSTVDDVAAYLEMERLRAERGVSPDPVPILTNVVASWYVYDPAAWTTWAAFSPTSSPTFPAAGPLRPTYDYAGADAAVRLEARADRHTPGAADSLIIWTAAAKPFGALPNDQRPDAYSLVLPAFTDVRLIPVDASSAPAGGAFNIPWRIHIEQHLPGYTDPSGTYLPGYMDGGLSAAAFDPACWYCQQLAQWEDASFRRGGVSWLSSYSNTCHVSGPGPGSAGGGRRRGH